MIKTAYTIDLLQAAKLAAVADNDVFLVYLIGLAIERASAKSVKLKEGTA